MCVYGFKAVIWTSCQRGEWTYRSILSNEKPQPRSVRDTFKTAPRLSAIRAYLVAVFRRAVSGRGRGDLAEAAAPKETPSREDIYNMRQLSDDALGAACVFLSPEDAARYRETCSRAADVLTRRGICVDESRRRRGPRSRVCIAAVRNEEDPRGRTRQRT